MKLHCAGQLQVKARTREGFGPRLARIRKGRGFSQEKVGEAVGEPESSYNDPSAYEPWGPCAGYEEGCTGGGGYNPPPGGANGSPPPAGDDMTDPIPQPDCRNVTAGQNRKVDAYCRGVPADHERGIKVMEALRRMKNISPQCAALADRGIELFNKGHIHIFPQNEFVADNIGGAAPRGGDHPWIALGNWWTDNYYDSTTATNEGSPRTFGRDHTDPPSNRETPNSRACDDVPG